MSAARARRDAHEQVFEAAEHAEKYCRCREELTRLASTLARAESAGQELAVLKQQRSALVAPDAATLKALRSAARARDEARLRLEAALITVEVVPVAPLELRSAATRCAPG